jgi:hypothetical protein
MKRAVSGILLVLSAIACKAQSHQVTLTWTASKDSNTSSPGTVSVYRAVGSCPAIGIGTLTYTNLTSAAPAGGPYIDSTVTAGTTYCYYITATINGATSQPSNTANATIPVFPPIALTIIIQ